MTEQPLQSRPKNANPLAHTNPRVRLANSALLLGAVHIGLFLFGNERATPLRLGLSFAAMMSVLGAIAYWRSLRSVSSKSVPPGATP